MTVRWGLLSTSGIGRVAARAIAAADGAGLAAVAGRDADRATAYAAEVGAPVAYGRYEDLLEDTGIDAVYVPLPITLHGEWAIRALEAGKHVLCEKPLTLDPDEATAVFDAAERAERHAIEGFMWRLHPQTLLVRRLLAEGAIGELALVRAALSVSAPAGDIRRTTALGGGALADLGGYCVSAVRLFGGEPSTVRAVRVADPAGTGASHDLRASAVLELEGGVLGLIDVGLDLERRDQLELVGTAGRIVVDDPWLCRYGAVELIRGERSERLPADPDGAFRLTAAGPDNEDAYRIEFEAASSAFAGGAEPVFGRNDAIAQARVLAAARRSAAEGVTVVL
ncbi:Gfo/Idh/MocA family protein [Tsukamurella ocularis]|uniref:Gfo/Idh/MocA family protein n=1 Tax=Tsukamurella ocularis TaxID=1970234 RepID=UPI0021683AAE|nr:Gfo/Idh/MocA family oxidoreductase [Tsukamurella ocularis]MCS3781943.1 putative dehydrogenase [Tsukamurella ocularis]MCS3788437.1 putative dehydrogenase [Tsukamurella ocularis]MCS3852157.1 putative dehydrogenase [Tsukamurella ocularis]